MPEFTAFAGVRYASPDGARDLSRLVAPPYDVIDDHEREALEARDAANAVRLILPRDETTAGDRYKRAAADYQAWQASGVLRVDRSPQFYGYRMDYAGSSGEPRHTVGVVGALALPQQVGGGDILPHERTMSKAKSDRLDLLRATRLNLDPIWGLSLALGLSDLLGDGPQLCHATDDAGVVHRLFSISDPQRIDAIRAAVASAPLVLADGHHRFETACAYRDECDAADEGAGSILTFVVELADEQLCIQPIHRLLRLPQSLQVRDALAAAFHIADAGENTPSQVDVLLSRMIEEGGIGLVDGDGLWLLRPTDEVCDRELITEPTEVRGTDAALVEACVVPRLSGAEWTFRHDPYALAGMVASKAADAALLLRPVSVATTRAAAVAATRMPAKTTFFYPKPRTGMVFRRLDARLDAPVS